MNKPSQSKPVRGLRKAWFYLAPNERMAIIIIFALVLIGLVARFWHLHQQASELSRVPVTSLAR